MVNLNPQTKSNKLLKELSAFSLSNRPNNFESKRLLREAESVKKVSLSEGWMITGIIYSFALEYKDSVGAFEKAVSLCSGNLSQCIDNYARALRLLGRPQEAFDLAEKYVSDDDFILLECVVMNAAYLGLFEKADKYIKKMEAFKNFKAQDFIFAKFNLELSKTAYALNVSENQCSAIHSLVLEAIFDAKKTIASRSIYVMEDSASLEFFIDADTDETFEISMSIIDRLAEVDDIPALQKGTFLPSIISEPTVYAN